MSNKLMQERRGLCHEGTGPGLHSIFSYSRWREVKPYWAGAGRVP